MSLSARWLATVAGVAGGTLVVLAAVPGQAAAAGPAPLSTDHARVNVDSSHGSGTFGRWGVDGRGLPRYRYEIDEETAPQAAQEELAGKRDAWHQLGNDHVVADAFNHGYTQLWSMDNLYQWANYAEPASQHYAGGYGYLNVDGKVGTTLYDDRAAGQKVQRDFGLGYFRTRTAVHGVGVSSRVYAPFGDDPLLLHDVVLRNQTRHTKAVSWFEYWDVNPYFPGDHTHPGLEVPKYDPRTRTLSVRQLPGPQNASPLTTFAAAVQGPLRGFDTNASRFFGSGGRAAPSEVKANRLSRSIAGPVPDGDIGHTGFFLRSPVRLRPGQSVTLRYAYGMAKSASVPALVRSYRKSPNPYAASASRWAKWVPQANLGGSRTWLSRELQWDAYMVRSDATYENCAGHHILSQGGYYQYDLDFQGAYRDPLQHALPMIYSDPHLAREVLLYSAAEQPRVGGQIPYARISDCQRLDLGTADDLDLWLLLTAAEYGLATRDTGFFNQKVPWADGGSATLWQHLKEAVDHQESLRGPHGEYLSGSTGDWSDFSTAFLKMTESNLVVTQAAYIYPRLAELASLRGDDAFASRLRSLGRGLLSVTRSQWVPRGWYARGYSGPMQLGRGVIFGEPQPWAILAGAPSPSQAAELVQNIRRFLTGIGAPGGPTRIGSSQSPAADDPGVHETSLGQDIGVGDNHAVYVGGSWFAVNGWLTWALGQLDGVVPKAKQYAFSEFRRNTLAQHATVYPNHWNGIISVDDACRSWYSTNSEECGVGLSTNYDTQIMHQPAWSLFDAIKLAGIEPDERGYTVTPHFPMRRFSLRLPDVGVQQKPRLIRGYVKLEASGPMRMRVALPPGSAARMIVAYANGSRVASRVRHGMVSFTLPGRAGHDADWAVVAR
jgi:hypothetical protein